MDPIGYEHALLDPISPCSSLHELVEDWHSQLSDDIDKITPQWPFCSRAKLASWYTLELWRMEQEIR